MYILVGKITKIDSQEITTKTGKTLRKFIVILDRFDNGKVACVDFVGMKVFDLFLDIMEGDNVMINFDVDCREYNGRMYTNLNGIGIEKYRGKKTIDKDEVALPIYDDHIPNHNTNNMSSEDITKQYIEEQRRKLIAQGPIEDKDIPF